MNKALACVSVLLIALLVWFLRGSVDSRIIDARTTEIAALQDTAQAKDKLLAQSGALADSRDETIKMLEEKMHSTEDLLAKDQAQLDSDKAALKALQDADQAKITSMQEDDQSTIQSLTEQIQSKDDEIAKLNEKLVQIVAYYGSQLPAPKFQSAPAPDDTEKIYPADNGFDAQDVGTGFFSYRYFGETIRNPTNVEMPPREPNRTPWVFTKDAGVAANDSGFYVANATNGDSDGKTSQMGQAAFLEFADSAVSQMVQLPTGTFTVTFGYEGRRDYTANEIAVSIDGTVLFKGAPTDTNSFCEVTTDPIKLSAGKHELKFLALGDGAGGSFPCTFIDNVQINIVGTHKRPAKSSEIQKAVFQSNALGGADRNPISP